LVINKDKQGLQAGRHQARMGEDLSTFPSELTRQKEANAGETLSRNRGFAQTTFVTTMMRVVIVIRVEDARDIKSLSLIAMAHWS